MIIILQYASRFKWKCISSTKNSRRKHPQRYFRSLRSIAEVKHAIIHERNSDWFSCTELHSGVEIFLENWGRFSFFFFFFFFFLSFFLSFFSPFYVSIYIYISAIILFIEPWTQDIVLIFWTFKDADILQDSLNFPCAYHQHPVTSSDVYRKRCADLWNYSKEKYLSVSVCAYSSAWSGNSSMKLYHFQTLLKLLQICL